MSCTILPMSQQLRVQDLVASHYRFKGGPIVIASELGSGYRTGMPAVSTSSLGKNLKNHPCRRTALISHMVAHLSTSNPSQVEKRWGSSPSDSGRHGSGETPDNQEHHEQDPLENRRDRRFLRLFDGFNALLAFHWRSCLIRSLESSMRTSSPSSMNATLPATARASSGCCASRRRFPSSSPG